MVLYPARVTFARIPASCTPQGLIARKENLSSGLPAEAIWQDRCGLSGRLPLVIQKTSTEAVCPGAAAIRWSRVIKGACNLSASATYAAS